MLRVLALLCLVYTVTVLAHVYFLLRFKIEGMDTVKSFMVLKGFVLLLTLQDLAVSLLMLSHKDDWTLQKQQSLKRAYPLLISIESLFFIPIMRSYFRPGIFLINADCTTPHGAAVNIPRFWLAVLAITHVLENDFVSRTYKKDKQMKEQSTTESDCSTEEVEIRTVTVVTKSVDPA